MLSRFAAKVRNNKRRRKIMEEFSSNSMGRKDLRIPKATPITDDYEISNHVLGLGINGKVVECYDRKTREKFALKVGGKFICYLL